MATNWVCPIDGAVPADNGAQTTGRSAASTFAADGQLTVLGGSSVNLNGAAALTGPDGFPPHCPICGAAMLVSSATVIATKTSVISGSQHPVDIDAVYATNVADGNNTQQVVTAAYSQGATVVRQHAFAALHRGTATVTAETVNGTVGP